MKVVFFIGKDKFGSAKNRLYADEVVSKQSITTRDNAAMGKDTEGYYIVIDGNEEAITKAKEIIKDDAKLLKGAEAEEIIKAIESQESNAADGFGAIFG
ncbi:MAG: hypothetical protein JW789_03990 [Candidatus Aenigmarchaeota archaeon]|nr:hypothetical protein [Candidatus Aenigmarchaeota archaeon]